jgi:gluconolactonase
MDAASHVVLPGPRELLPGRPDAIVDLQTSAGADLVGGRWRYQDVVVRETGFVEVADHLGPGEVPNRTFEIEPHAHEPGFDDSAWRELTPEQTQLRLAGGLVCFCWYRIELTVPERVGSLEAAGATIVFEVVVDDYAEVWVNGELPHTIGQAGGEVVAGFNVPNRVVLSTDARPGERFVIAVFGINGPISASPRNYIWMRSATLDLYRDGPATALESRPLALASADPRIESIVAPDATLERVASGFQFTEGPLWDGGGLLFSSPNTNCIYRWSAPGSVGVFRAKSGYCGTDIGRYTQPGSNGLSFDSQRRLTICQHGNRRVIRVEPHGNISVLAERFDGRRLNSPNDLVYRSDDTLFFTDPPFGLPGVFDDPAKELPFSGVFAVRGGVVTLVTDELAGPNGLAFSPDERHLYVGDWDPDHKVVMRYEIDADANLLEREVLCDLTAAPGDAAIDGLKVDRDGNVYVCGPGGVWVISPAGETLAQIVLPEEPHNLAWGEADACTLYVTALSSIYRIRTRVPGIRAWEPAPTRPQETR